MAPRLCLNMIVKDEAHIILECLESMVKHICYWIISDTGSTDGTQDLIKKFFEEKGILGELHEDKWVDFATNRNIALKYGYQRKEFDYLWVMDADDYLEGTPDFPKVMDADLYKCRLRDVTDFDSFRPLIFSNKCADIKYKGIIHEAIYLNDPAIIENILGEYRIKIRTIGNRSKDPEKYLKDAQMCVIGIKLKDELQERYTFYAAQGYLNGGNYPMAIKYYKKVRKLNQERGHVYDSYLNEFFCWSQLKKEHEYDEKMIDLLQKAAEWIPERRDAKFLLARFLNQLNRFEEALKEITECMQLKFPVDDSYISNPKIYGNFCVELIAEILCNLKQFDRSIFYLNLINDQTVNTQFIRDNIANIEAEKLKKSF